MCVCVREKEYKIIGIRYVCEGEREKEYDMRNKVCVCEREDPIKHGFLMKTWGLLVHGLSHECM